MKKVWPAACRLANEEGETGVCNHIYVLLDSARVGGGGLVLMPTQASQFVLRELAQLEEVVQ